MKHFGKSRTKRKDKGKVHKTPESCTRICQNSRCTWTVPSFGTKCINREHLSNRCLYRVYLQLIAMQTTYTQNSSERKQAKGISKTLNISLGVIYLILVHVHK